MGISYVSKPIKSNPYVLPFDLNLMAKALQVKDSAFKQNAFKIQSGLDALASLPMKDEEGQQYLKGKVNNLVSQVNDLGNIDLSDLNVGNQINGFIGSIPNDPIVTTQVAGMKSAQAEIAKIEKIKYDPKLSHLYSPANEWAVQNKVQQWRMDKSPDSKLGDVTYSPYVNLDKEVFNVVKNMKSQAVKTENPNGSGYIYSINGKTLTEAQIAEAAQQQVYNNPNNLKQAQINGSYLYQGYTPDLILKELTNNNNSKIVTWNDRIKDMEAKRAVATDGEKDNLNAQIKEAKDYVTSLKTYQTGLNLDEVNKNRDHYLTEMYTGKLASNYGRILQVNEQERGTKFDQTWGFVTKLNNENDRFNKTLQFKYDELQGRKDIANQKAHVGKPGESPTDNVTVGGTYDDATAPVIKTDRKEETYFINQNQDIEKQQTQTLRDWITNQSNLNPEIAKFFTPELEQWFTKYGEKNGASSELTANNNTFDISDLGAVRSQANINTLKNNFKLNDKQIGFIQGLYNQWRGKAMGNLVPDVEFDKTGMTDLFATINNLDRRKRLNDNIVSETRNMLVEGLTKQEQQVYLDYKSHPEKYTTHVAQVGSPYRENYTPAFDQVRPDVAAIIAKAEAPGKKDKVYQRISDRYQPSLLTLNNLDDKGSPVEPLITDNIITNLRQGLYAGDSGGLYGKASAKPINLENHKSISFVQVGKQSRNTDITNGTSPYYAVVHIKEKGDDAAKVVYVPIDKGVAERRFGNTVNLDAESQLVADEVNFRGVTNKFQNDNTVEQPATSVTIGSGGRSIPFSYRITAVGDKPQGSPNRPAVGQLVVYNPDTKQKEYITVTQTLSSAPMALEAMKQVIAQYSQQQKTTFEQQNEYYNFVRQLGKTIK